MVIAVDSLWCPVNWYFVFTDLKGDNDADDDTCKPLSQSEYNYLVWTTCAVFPGQPSPWYNPHIYLHYLPQHLLWLIVLLQQQGGKHL